MQLPSLASKRIIRALRKAGFDEAPDRGKGSHRAFVKKDGDGTVRLVIVPHGQRTYLVAPYWRSLARLGCPARSSSSFSDHHTAFVDLPCLSPR
ncbi:MAG: type II toxin-antitoxin system HicA family toxin [Nitrospirae bacterium]|nr:type II toxin-antitoxin system HicA family toxin [Nitrospirota bacterium]